MVESIYDIMEYSKDPNVLIPQIQGTLRPITTLTDLWDVDVLGITKREHFVSPRKKTFDIKFDNNDVMDFLLPLKKRRPCLYYGMLSRNPDHMVRVNVALWAKSIGLNHQEFKRIYEQIGGVVGYLDLHNSEYRHEQITGIWENQNYNRGCAGCRKIKGYLPPVCLGDSRGPNGKKLCGKF
jgi:hypothetical protein